MPIRPKTSVRRELLGAALTDHDHVEADITDLDHFDSEDAQDAVGTILTDSPEIDFTYNDATPSITAAIVAASIDETKLDTSVNASLDLADSATQPGDDADTLGSGAASDGQVLTADGIGGAAWEAVPTATGTTLLAREIYTTNDTWTKADYTGIQYIIVRVAGGGGGGGGAATTAAGQAAGAAGGGGGGFSESVIQAASLGATEAVTVGTGGAGAAAGANAGSAGNASSFGTHVTANAGTQGGGGAASAGDATPSTAGNGAAAGTGQLALGGGDGLYGVRLGSLGIARGGSGGQSFYGNIVNGGGNSNGSNGSGFGGGGSGGGNNASQGTARAGGDGANGIVIVDVYGTG